LDSYIVGQNKTVAFINVNIIPMDEERIINNQTVLVKDGVIKAIGDQNIVVPDDTVKIQASGKYLMPGLVDMHTHFNSLLPFFGIKDEWILYLANGVTSVRNMWGIHKGWYHPVLSKIKKIKNGTLPYPTIYTGGQILEGKPQFFPYMSTVINSPSKAEKIIESEKKKGYDFIKIYHTLSEEGYKEVARASKKYGINFLGHVPDKIGIEGAVSSGQHSMEHLIGFFNPFTGKPLLDEKTIEKYAAMISGSGTWNCPTMVVWQRYLSPEKIGDFEKRSEMAYISDKIKTVMRNALVKASTNLFIPDNYLSYLRLVVGKLHEAGAKIILGTDASNPFVIPGFSIHEELLNLTECGLSNYEAIKTGTKNAAECLNKLHEFGTISVGKRADLILLDKNPLEDVRYIKNPEGVMVRGIWTHKEQIEKMLEYIKS
jgi:imidazolonepropionase-like amidohydrolase